MCDLNYPNIIQKHYMKLILIFPKNINILIKYTKHLVMKTSRCNNSVS